MFVVKCDRYTGEGQTGLFRFGPFNGSGDAEVCVLALSQQDDVLGAVIETVRSYAKPGTADAAMETNQE